MTKYILVLSFLFSNIVWSQDSNCSLITYTQTFNLTNTVVSNYKLYATNKSSLYLETDIITSKDKIYLSRNSLGNSRRYSTGRKNTAPNFYINHKNEFYFREYFHNELILVKENSSEVRHNWTIENETKSVGNFLCSKATTTFRGRDYIAWFSYEIPLPFGPWKFSGLPGLILEVYDKEMALHFVTNTIQINKFNNCDDSINSISLDNYVDINQYQIKKDEILDEIFRKISSRQPAGSKPIKRDKNCTDCGDKLEYF